MWIWIQIVLVLFFVLCILAFFIRQNEFKNRWITCISIVLTLFGLAMAIADEYLSQYDYNLDTIRKYESYRKNGVSFENLLKNNITIPPEYIFVVDVSGSMSSKKKDFITMTESLSNQLGVIQKGRLGTGEPDFGITKEGKIRYDKAMQIKVLYSLAQLEKMEYPDSCINYSIVYFGRTCNRHHPLPTLPLKNRINESYDNVMKQKFDEKQTDFLELFKYLYDEYFTQHQTQENRSLHRNLFGKKDYIALFYTDYINDITPDDWYKTKKELDSIVTKIEDSNVNLTLFVVKDEKDSFDSTLIIKLLKERLSESAFQILDLRDSGNAFDYPIVSRSPIPFYYSNRIFEDSLRTLMSFELDDSKKLGFRLVNNSKSGKQEFRLYRRGEKKPFRISVNNKRIHIRQNDLIELEIFGYIPAPYESPDVVIEDVLTGIHYVFPVVFYKTLPSTVMVLIFVISLVCLYMLYFFIWVIIKNN